MIRKTIFILLIPILVLPFGCFRNTPQSVAKRFLINVKNLKWDKMEKMVDWETTEKQANNLPQASQNELILLFAAACTRNKYMHDQTDEQIQHKLVYMRAFSSKVIEEDNKTAKVKVVYRIENKGDDFAVEFRLRKVKREWKVVLKPYLFDHKYYEPLKK